MATGSSSAVLKYVVAVLGGKNVGKSALIRRFIEGEFKEKYEFKEGVAVHLWKAVCAGTEMQLEIWDVTQPDDVTIEDAQAAVVLYDVTDNQSLLDAKNLLHNLFQSSSRKILALIGTKADSYGTRKMDAKSASDLAENFGAFWMETSAKSGANVSDVFSAISGKLTSQAYQTVVKGPPEIAMECQICMEKRKYLKKLHCGHKLCSACLEHMMEKEKDLVVTCPMCRQEHEVLDKWNPSASFPSAFAGTLECQLCLSEKEIDEFWYCTKCISQFCSKCELKQHTTKKHQEFTKEWQPDVVIGSCIQTVQNIPLKQIEETNSKKLDELLAPVLKSVKEQLNCRTVKKIQDLEALMKFTFCPSEPGENENPAIPVDLDSVEKCMKIAESAFSLAGVQCSNRKECLELSVEGFVNSDFEEKLSDLLLSEIKLGNLDSFPVPQADVSKPVSQSYASALSQKPIELPKAESEWQEVKTSNREKKFTVGKQLNIALSFDKRTLAFWKISLPSNSVEKIFSKNILVEDAAISDKGGRIFVLARQRPDKSPFNEGYLVHIFDMKPDFTFPLVKTIDIGCRMPKVQTLVNSCCIACTNSGFIAYFAVNETDTRDQRKWSNIWRLSSIQPHQSLTFFTASLSRQLSVHFKALDVRIESGFSHTPNFPHRLLGVDSECSFIQTFIRHCPADDLVAQKQIPLPQGSLTSVLFLPTSSRFLLVFKEKYEVWDLPYSLSTDPPAANALQNASGVLPVSGHPYFGGQIEDRLVFVGQCDSNLEGAVVFTGPRVSCRTRSQSQYRMK